MKQYDLNKRFFYRLSDAIINSGKSVKQISKDIGCHENTLFSFIRGDSLINIALFASLCEELNISADWLLFGKEEK